MLLSWRACLIAAVLTGCASIDSKDFRQPVKLVSDPQGVKVYEDGRLLGTTPGYYRMRRRQRPTLTYQFPDGSQRTIALKAKYRWPDSFAANLLWLTFAPAGWLTDWVTGTAWEIQDPPSENGRIAPRRVAVAPPLAMDPEMADALGVLVADRLRKTSSYQVLDYATTAPQFDYYDSSKGLSEDKDDRYGLLSELKADHILVTRADARNGGFHVQGSLVNAFDGSKHSGFSGEFLPESTQVTEQLSQQRMFSSFFHLVPNTVYVNLSSYSPSITVQGAELQGREIQNEGFSQKMLNYISAISVGRVERPRDNVLGRWLFGFVPSAALSVKRIRFDNYTPVKGVEFERTYASAGYGFQAGHLSRWGFLFLDFVPSLTWSRVEYETDQVNGDLSRFSIQYAVELGYQYLFTDHLIGKFFVRGLGEDSKLWNEAISHVVDQTVYADSVNSNYVGISLGYYIPSRISRQGWKAK